MNMQPNFDHLADYDVIVIGAGHAGIEAAHAAVSYTHLTLPTTQAV